MNFLRAFGRQPRAWILAEMIVAVLVIGVFDAITGYEVRLLPFYAGPIFVVAWFCNRKLAVLVSLIAGVTSLTADWIPRDPDLMGWTRPWEITRHMATCLIVALVGSALRAKTESAAARIELLEHAQRLEREIVSISDAEQRRIGQDLHDGLCQYLAALCCSATSLQEDLEKRNLKSESAAAAKLAKLLQKAVVQARDLAHELIPAQVAQVGLALALQSLTDSVSRLQGVQCAFEFHGEQKSYSEPEAAHLYRIAQEAINNATRHGKAKRIHVSLRTSGEETTLEILDNGVGFSEARSNGSGRGLNIMRYRARQVGGELTIAHPADGGTLVACRVRTNHVHGDEIANS